MDRLLFPTLEFKMLDVGEAGGPGSAEGYACVFGNRDRSEKRDIILPGAVKNVDALVGGGFSAVMHNWRESQLPVATIEEARQDDYGLFTRILFHSTPAAQDARTVAKERLERGKPIGLSIGFEALEFDNTPEGRNLKAIDVFEVSLTPIPANPLALITDVKDSLPGGRLRDGLPFGEHSQAVRAAVQEFKERALAIAKLRAEEGRSLSEERVLEIRELRDALAELKALEPELEDLLARFAQKAPVPDVMRAWVQLQESRAWIARMKAEASGAQTAAQPLKLGA